LRIVFLRIVLLAVTFVSLLLSACSASDNAGETIKITGKTMGTSYNISLNLVSNISADRLQELRHAIDDRLSEIDQLMSTYSDDSEISRFNRSSVGSQTPVSNDTRFVLQTSVELNSLTQGAFDITVGPLVDLWGFGGQSIGDRLRPSGEAIDVALSQVGMSKVLLKSEEIVKLSPVNVDLSAIAKGYAVDEIARSLDGFDLDNYLVEIGGEVRAKGVNKRNTLWVLGIESPDKRGRNVYTTVQLDQQSLATSGDYRNYFEQDGQRFSHTIDPVTGKPVTHNLASVSVITDSCMMADALATALMVMGEDKGYDFAKKHDIGALFIYRSDKGFVTKRTKSFEVFLK
jgi:FAD:protein FMN transferase